LMSPLEASCGRAESAVDRLQASLSEFRAGSRTARSAAAWRSPEAILDAVLSLGRTLRHAIEGEGSIVWETDRFGRRPSAAQPVAVARDHLMLAMTPTTQIRMTIPTMVANRELRKERTIAHQGRAWRRKMSPSPFWAKASAKTGAPASSL